MKYPNPSHYCWECNRTLDSGGLEDDGHYFCCEIHRIDYLELKNL
jgi:hypothetical protein